MKVEARVAVDLKPTARVRQVCAMFDAPASEKTTRVWTGEVPLEERPWQIGLIVGPSGAGKSTIARQMFGAERRPTWDDRKSVIDCFDTELAVDAITGACSAVGFNTIPAWVRPYGTLSNGERFRVDLARVIAEHKDGIAWVDEFTSVVDRQVAQIGSHAVAKYVRRQPGLQFVAVGCHYDVIDWLQPDWTLEPATMTFAWRSVQRRPTIDVEIRRVHRSMWAMFAPYHYLTRRLHRAATCFALYIGERPVVFAGMISLPVSQGSARGTAIWRLSRVVTLPDWQGLGLVFVMMNALGAAYAGVGSRYRIYPAHPSFVRSCARSKVWRQVKRAGTFDASSSVSAMSTTRGDMGGRPCATFEYVGAPMDARQARRLIARG